jgi:hypothetical protein
VLISLALLFSVAAAAPQFLGGGFNNGFNGGFGPGVVGLRPVGGFGGLGGFGGFGKYINYITVFLTRTKIYVIFFYLTNKAVAELAPELEQDLLIFLEQTQQA